MRAARALLAGLLILPTLGLPACAQVPPPPRELPPRQPVSAPAAPLPGDAAPLIARSGLPARGVGYVVLDPRTGDTVAAHNGHTPYMPASVTKIVMAVAALDLLGPDYRFRTAVYGDGPVENGVLQGNLYLKGEGDPFLDLNDLMVLAQRVRHRGIRGLTGQVRYSVEAFPEWPYLKRSQPLHETYNPAISPLSVGFNRIRVLREADGETFGTIPAWSALTVSGGSGYRRSERGGVATWTIPASKKGEWLPVRRPGYYAASQFSRLLTEIGVTVGAAPARTAQPLPDSARLVAAHHGQPVTDLVTLTMEHSNNLMAELLGVAAARRLDRTPPASLAEARARVDAWLKARLPGVDWTGWQGDNFSGLSAGARMTPAQLAAVLTLGQRTADGALVGTLPINGYKGTLDRVLAVPLLGMRVWAKTGTMNYGVALAGWLYPPAGDPLIFALFINDKEARLAFDQRRPTGTLGPWPWLDRARTLQETLLVHWLENGAGRRSR